MLPRSSFLFLLRCSAAPFPTFACPPPSFCSFCSSSHPRSNPSLLLAFCTSASSWLALLLLVGNLLMFRHVSERVVLPASRKFAEGRGGRRFLEQGILDNPHIYIHIMYTTQIHIYIYRYIYTYVYYILWSAIYLRRTQPCPERATCSWQFLRLAVS